MIPLESKPLAQDLAAFVDACPTPFHVVEEAIRRLRRAGFVLLDEREDWHLDPGMRALIKRGGGTLLALQLGTQAPSEAGYLVLGAHTDSPNLRLKPQPDNETAGYRQLGVEIYGSPVWHTWLDRDLSIAGRVVLTQGRAHLVRMPGAPCCIPGLAIHLHRGVNTEGLKLDPEAHLRPILAPTRRDEPGVLEWIVAE